MKMNRLRLINFIFAFLLGINIISAQITKGTYHIGATVGYRIPLIISDSLTNSLASYPISLSTGYYLYDNLELGLSISYSSIEHSLKLTSDTYTNKWSSFSFGPTIGYMIPLSKRFYIPVAAEIRYEKSNSHESSYSGFEIVASTGAEYIINKNLGVTMKTSYGTGKLMSETKKVLYLKDIFITFGINYYLGLGKD